MAERAVQIQASGETPLAPRLPLRIGRFTLCQELGSGGMATVYLARMQLAAGLERLVALKTIHPHLAKETAFVDMFLDEARIASHVTHPNVCSTHDFGEVGQVYYLAMEYLLGEPVFDVINRLVERFDDIREVLPYLAARIVADACEGLHAAHVARGPDGERLDIVHRDVSPQNLFLTYDGSVKVVDFGCAKAAERVAHTSTGVVKGKVGYAAPEQIKGGPVDARADVWALGVVLWETLTLSPLFSRETAMSTAMAVLEEDVENAADGRDWVPRKVADIAARALHRDVDARFGSAREMGRVLRKFIADSGYTLESAELAEWMDFLFDDHKTAKIAMARRVRELDISHVSSGQLAGVSDDDVELLESDRPPPLEAIPLDDPDPRLRGPAPEVSGPMRRQPQGALAESSEPPPLPTRRRARWPWVVLTLIAFGVAGYYLHRYYEIAPWFLELVGSSPGDADGSRSTAAEDPAPSDRGRAPDPEAESASAMRDEGQRTPGAEERPSGDVEPPGDDPSDVPGGTDGTADAPPRRSQRRRRRGGSVTTVVSGGGAASYDTSGAGAPSPRARSETGHLVVRAASGWAEVFMAGRRLGRTPVEREVPVGTHRLRVLPYGRSDAAEIVIVHVSSAATERLTLDVDAPSE